MCRYFQLGTCNRGDKCRFSHAVALPGPVEDSGKTPPAAPRGRSASRTMCKDKPCYQWQKSGTCEYGKDCIFSHDLDTSGKVKATPSTKTEKTKAQSSDSKSEPAQSKSARKRANSRARRDAAPCVPISEYPDTTGFSDASVGSDAEDFTPGGPWVTLSPLNSHDTRPMPVLQGWSLTRPVFQGWRLTRSPLPSSGRMARRNGYGSAAQGARST